MRRASRVAATLACLAADAPRARAAAFDRARLAGACRARRWSASAPSDVDVARDPATAASAGAARAGDLHFRDPPPRPPHRRVVVTGIGLVTPLGAGTARTWAALMAGESGVRAIGPDDVPEGPDGYDQLSVRVAAVVPRRDGSTNPDEPFDLAEWCASPSVAPFAGYALCAAAEATADAGIVAYREIFILRVKLRNLRNLPRGPESMRREHRQRHGPRLGRDARRTPARAKQAEKKAVAVLRPESPVQRRRGAGEHGARLPRTEPSHRHRVRGGRARRGRRVPRRAERRGGRDARRGDGELRGRGHHRGLREGARARRPGSPWG
jgi:hypothetical protein